jgi:chemotaxis protein CheY-P-specific phosphatase CheC
MSAPDARSPELDRVCELAGIGAGHAAGALARLVGRPIRMDVPRVQPRVAGVSAALYRLGAGGSAICFRLEGGLGGAMAVIFSRSCLELIVTEMMGADAYGLERAVESAVREAGNVLVSHFASAIGDVLGKIVLPSVPLLTDPGDLDGFLEGCEPPLAGIVVESAIFDTEREVSGALVLIPELGALAGGALR